MADTREHPVYPLRLGAGGIIVTAEQGSDAEIQSCMAVVLKWPLGTRELDPDFGVPEENFQTGGADLDDIKAALAHGEPRALTQLTADDSQLAQAIATVNVGWNVSDAGVTP